MSLAQVTTAGSKALGDRFNLVNAIPATVPATVFLLLARGGGYSGAFIPSTVAPDLTAVTGAGAVLFVAGVLMLGVLIAPFQVGLVRLLEGYWGTSRIAGRLTAIGVEIQRRRLAATLAAMDLGEAATPQADLSALAAQRKTREARVRKAQIAARRRQGFPDEASLLPTSLGNTLRAAETTAGERYGLATVPSFPRLRNVLSARLDSSLGQLLTQLDTGAALCISFAISAALATPLLLEGWFCLVPLVFAAMSVLSYRGARVAASYHGQLLEVAYDLHRFDLLVAMHYELPATPEHELQFNTRLSAFLSSRGRAVEVMPDPYRHTGDAPDVSLE